MFVFSLLIMPTTAFSASINATNITDLGTSARMIGLGNIEGFGDDSSVLFENPAALANVNNWSTSIFGTTIMNAVNYSAWSAAYRTRYGTFALGRMGAAVSDIPYTRAGSTQFEIISLFDYTNSLYKLGYQYSFDDSFSIGTAMNIYDIQASQFLEGNGINFDVGALYEMRRFHLTTSLVLRNIVSGEGIQFNGSSKEELPQHAVLGLRFSPRDNWSVYAQGKHYDMTNKFYGSYAFELHPLRVPFLKLTIANKSFPVSTIRDRSITSFGSSLHFGPINFFYAYEASENPVFDGRNFFSIAFNF